MGPLHDPDADILFSEEEMHRMMSDPAFGYVCRNGHPLTDSDRRYIEIEGICPGCEADARREEEDYLAQLEEEGGEDDT